MKLKKLWDWGLTVFVVIFIYFLLKHYFPVIILEIGNIIGKFMQDVKNSIQSI
jgi:hypothetical protein